MEVGGGGQLLPRRAHGRPAGLRPALALARRPRPRPQVPFYQLVPNDLMSQEFPKAPVRLVDEKGDNFTRAGIMETGEFPPRATRVRPSDRPRPLRPPA